MIFKNVVLLLMREFKYIYLLSFEQVHIRLSLMSLVDMNIR